MQEGKETLSLFKKIIKKVLKEENLSRNEWHVGKVSSVISTKLLNVYVNGSTIVQKIPCNPNVTFSVGEEVWVHFVNGDSKNKFVPYKRAIAT